MEHVTRLIVKLMTHSLATDSLLEEARSILAYALLHPIFDGSDEYKRDLIEFAGLLQDW